ERPKKENILDLSKYIDKDINVKFNGGREIKGKLRGFDGLMNLVLDDVWETLQGTANHSQGKPAKRFLGLLVARGTLLTIISPCDGSEEIQNPFA
ncbi:LSM-domain-containing protein, partial [Pseudovirgaria hyperparasitica]